jgi:hypothetical protein
MQRRQAIQLRRRLDTLPGRHHPEPVAQIDYCCNDRVGVVVLTKLRHEGAIDD